MYRYRMFEIVCLIPRTYVYIRSDLPSLVSYIYSIGSLIAPDTARPQVALLASLYFDLHDACSEHAGGGAQPPVTFAQGPYRAELELQPREIMD